MNKNLLIAYLELSFAQFCIGANIILGKSLIEYFPIYSLLLFRFLIGFFISIVCLLFSTQNNTQDELKKLSVRDWIIIFLQAICGGFLFNVLVLWGLQYTTASITGIINSAVPAFVAFFSFLILKERLTFGKSLAIFLCVLGISVLSFGKTEKISQSSNDLLGIFLVLLAVVPEAMFTIFSKLLKKPLAPMTTTLLVNFFNALLFLPLSIIFDSGFHASISILNACQIFLYGLSGGVLFFMFWYRGLRHVTANTAALFMGIMPISTTFLAYMFLNETLSIWDAIGMVCVVSSIYFGTRQFKIFQKEKAKPSVGYISSG